MNNLNQIDSRAMIYKRNIRRSAMSDRGFVNLLAHHSIDFQNCCRIFLNYGKLFSKNAICWVGIDDQSRIFSQNNLRSGIFLKFRFRGWGKAVRTSR